MDRTLWIAGIASLIIFLAASSLTFLGRGVYGRNGYTRVPRFYLGPRIVLDPGYDLHAAERPSQVPSGRGTRR